MLVKRNFKVYAQMNGILRYDKVLNATQSSPGDLKKVVAAVETIIGENALKKYFGF